MTIKNEDNKIYLKRIQCIEQKANNERLQAELQEKILNEIANATGNLLENEELYNTLDESKQACISIEEELAQMKKALDLVENRRNDYRPVARRVSMLFFCISDLANVDPMYQYSLKWFSDLYEKSIERLGKMPDKPTAEEKRNRIGDIIRCFTELLYKNVCRSLFEKDKLLFSLLLCMKIMEEKGELDKLEARFLMTGGSWADSKKPNPTGENGWLSNKSWLQF
ncbi:hypothetical protein COB52_04615 [Candidatus Kaiserbacteria bacterium]|nr:MAG: hypothetical protein COB52_04615 [Candidatus Kaiserbacteria bacterium]